VLRYALVLAALGCSSSSSSMDSPDAREGVDGTVVAVDAPTAAARVPILFIHGINGKAANFDALIARLVADGWPTTEQFARTFNDPSWGCNVDNAATIGQWVDEIRASTGAAKVNVIAHSMGTLSSRHFIKALGGTAKVERYITLGGMHHGLSSSCAATFPGAPCVWRELCETGTFVQALNAPPATPGNLHWVSIFGTADETVPNASSQVIGAENIAIPNVTHEGLLDDAPTFVEIKRVLAYPPK
jgi:triacylglycerol lipase